MPDAISRRRQSDGSRARGERGWLRHALLLRPHPISCIRAGANGAPGLRSDRALRSRLSPTAHAPRVPIRRRWRASWRRATASCAARRRSRSAAPRSLASARESTRCASSTRQSRCSTCTQQKQRGVESISPICSTSRRQAPLKQDLPPPLPRGRRRAARRMAAPGRR